MYDPLILTPEDLKKINGPLHVLPGMSGPARYPGVPQGIPADATSKPMAPPPIGSSVFPHPYTFEDSPSASSDTSAATNTGGGNQTDPYLQSLQNALKADQQLIDHPYQQPQYKPPAKGLEYLSAGLSLLFPGSPIASVATGLAGGLVERSQNEYARAEQAEQQRVANLERTAQLQNQVADAQGAIAQRREATDERHSEVLSRLQQQSQEFAQTYKLKSQTLQARVNYQNGMLANMAARNTITQQDAQLAAATRYQVAVLQQAGADRRNVNNNRLRTLITQATTSTTQTDAQLRSIDAAVAAGSLDPTQAQTQAAAIISANQAKVASLLNEASAVAPGDPSIGSIGALQSVSAPTQQNPNGWPQPPSSVPPVTINVSPNGITNGAVLPGEQTTLSGTPQQQPTQQTPPSVFAGHPALGHGQGVPDQTLKGAADYYTQHASQFASADAVLHDIAASPGGALLSAPQVQQILQSWEHTQAAHAQQHANPAAASTKGATAQHAPPAPMMNGLGADSTGAAPSNPSWLTNAVHAVENKLNEWNQPIVEPAKAAESKPQTVLEAITHTAKNTKGLGDAGVPLLRALVAAESGDNPNAQSGVGAIGLGQLMPGTAKELGVNPNDPQQNLEGSARYLAQLLQQFHSIPLALAAYNAGPGAVQKYRGIPPYPETQAYVQRVLGIYRKLTAGR